MAEISLSQIKQAAQERRSRQDSELEALGYKRVGSRYLKIPQAPEIALEEQGISILTPDEAARFGVPYGTTRGQVFGQEVREQPTTEQRNKQSQTNKALEVLNQIEKYSSKVNTFGAGKTGSKRILEGSKRFIGGKLQINKDAALLMAQSGKLSNLIRALGEVGALAEGDVQRGIALLPNVFDTKEIASQKITDLKELFSAAGQPQQTKQTSNDPLGIF